MNNIINQFRRIYSDNGSGDRDFSKEEAKLKEAKDKLVMATNELSRASERLNSAALKTAGGYIEH